MSKNVVVAIVVDFLLLKNIILPAYYSEQAGGRHHQAQVVSYLYRFQCDFTAPD